VIRSIARLAWNAWAPFSSTILVRAGRALRAAGQIGPDGGMGAWSGAPTGDLLSTAVGLHALRHCGTAFDDVRKRCLDFIDSLWSSHGGFRGHQGDETLDCEYAFYGLLALGNLDG